MKKKRSRQKMKLNNVNITPFFLKYDIAMTTARFLHGMMKRHRVIASSSSGHHIIDTL